MTSDTCISDLKSNKFFNMNTEHKSIEEVNIITADSKHSIYFFIP